MRAVTATAGHFPVPQRMSRGLEEFGPQSVVTIEADLCLARPLHNRVTARVHVVATTACGVAGFMAAAGPQESGCLLVAAQADGVVLIDRCRRLCTKERNCRAHIAVTQIARVISARPMACLTLKSCEGRSGISGATMRSAKDFKNGELGGFVVTPRTGVGPGSGVRGRGHRLVS